MSTDAIWALGARVARGKQIERAVGGIPLCEVKSLIPAKRRDRADHEPIQMSVNHYLQ